eukprot:5264616-Prymnesium_polylepis.1
MKHGFRIEDLRALEEIVDHPRKDLLFEKKRMMLHSYMLERQAKNSTTLAESILATGAKTSLELGLERVYAQMMIKLPEAVSMIKQVEDNANRALNFRQPCEWYSPQGRTMMSKSSGGTFNICIPSILHLGPRLNDWPVDEQRLLELGCHRTAELLETNQGLTRPLDAWPSYQFYDFVRSRRRLEDD